MKKKILFITNNLSGGGAERILQIIAQNLNRSKFDITIYSLHKPQNLEDWPDDVKYSYIFKSGCRQGIFKFLDLLENKFKLLIYDHCSAKLFYKLFIRGKYDTEIAFIEGYATRIVSGSMNANSKKLAWLHIDIKQNHWSKIAYSSDSAEIHAYQQFHKIVGVSMEVAQSINKLFPSIPPADVVYNPIDEQEIINKSKEQPTDLDFNKHAVRLVSVGRLVEQKGYDRLIPVIGSLTKKGYNIELNIVGEGPEHDRLQQLINDSQLNANVRLLGHRDNPYPYIAQADAFICSSRAEGFSTVVTEALILGVPVVTTECAGMRELLGENSEYGIITQNNELSLEQSIEKLLQPGKLDYYRQLAQKRGAEFNLKSLMSKFEECL